MRHVLTLELNDDPELIAAYEAYHARGQVWPEITRSIRAAGITAMTIHRLGTRLVMIIDADDDFSFARKAALDAANPAVQRWEALMARFQKIADPDAKWQPMNLIFALDP